MKRKKNFLFLKGLSNLSKGFTITELVIYMSILLVLITLLGRVFVSILDVQLESQSTSSVEIDGRYILAKLIHDMNSMQTGSPTNDVITTPTSPGQTDSTLTFTSNSINYTYSLNNGNLQLVKGIETNNLNGIYTTISGLQFTRIGTGASTDTIRISFTVTSKVTRNAGPETRSYTTTISSQ
jgi:type II secretory pathway pseudopilin PulG